ncbi:MAG: pyridoxamine 5'-phosphate oxidase family protein [Candidatus Omnitrophica bacterium]|nr:pyridoxamine 5'-phosphate oxidase family protein [Candidatus Omnitrophota bacterium]
MKKIPAEIINFLGAQDFVIISSIDKAGFPHSSCKAIIRIDQAGRIFLVDLYHGATCENIKANPRISISAVDEHKFAGYCLKGRGEIMSGNNISQEIIKIWEDNITGRLAKRLLKNLSGDRGHGHHPEASLPHPKHIIVIKVEEIVDLAPVHLRKEK